MPEHKYGVNKVKVFLKDGREYSEVFVAWGDEIIRVGRNSRIPFELSDVSDVENDL